MTDRDLAVPNARSPGTPVCHPDDACKPLAHQQSKNISVMQDSEYVELHASSAFSFLDGASQPESLD